jgi:hypothetical protein
MVRPCVARGHVKLAVNGLESMYPASGWSSSCPAIMDISAHAISLADRPQWAIWVTSARRRREDRSSISSSSRRPRQVRQKIVAAVTSGVVPDVFPNQPGEMIALYAWNDQLVDLTDVVGTQREEYTDTALLTALCYNNVEKKRSFYGAPYTQGVLPNHVWRSRVEGHTAAQMRAWVDLRS